MEHGNVIVYAKDGCPKCKVLCAKLDRSGIKYDTIKDMNVMQEKGFKSAPQLEVNGTIMDFGEAVKWIGEQ